jgi:serine O-acetyltransferase
METYSRRLFTNQCEAGRRAAARAAGLDDPVWSRIRGETLEIARSEERISEYLTDTILKPGSLEEALSAILASKLESGCLRKDSVREIFLETLTRSPGIREAIRKDLNAIVDRDPAAGNLAIPFLFFKGFHALQAYRISHSLWLHNRRVLAHCLQSRISEVFGVDIHPAARIGSGILIDHATSVVIGETAVVGDDVSILHEVTLGGTGKEAGDRHPKIGNGVMIGAGAKILGNIRIGEGCKVAAGSVALEGTPPNCTVAGVPARVVGRPRSADPAKHMDRRIELDYCI